MELKQKRDMPALLIHRAHDACIAGTLSDAIRDSSVTEVSPGKLIVTQKRHHVPIVAMVNDSFVLAKQPKIQLLVGFIVGGRIETVVSIGR